MGMPHDKWKKVVYYLDEGFIFLIFILTVVFRETIKGFLKGDPMTHLALHAPKIIGAILGGILLYGSMNQSFAYNDRKKPSLYKRICSIILQGLGWDSASELIP